MANLLIIDDRSDWPHKTSGAEIVTASRYLTDPQYMALRGARVYNLCRSYRYQSTGYYVSLLARARGHKPFPGVATIQDLKTPLGAYMVSEDLDRMAQRALSVLQGNEFRLSIYFGRNLAKRYQRLATQIFNIFPAPLLRAEFRRKHGHWQLKQVRSIPLGQVPPSHLEFLHQVAAEQFAKARSARRHATRGRFDLAIMVNEQEPFPPSDPPAIRQFVRAGREVGFNVELITRNDHGRVGEFDALFIRETTSVNHHTYRCARRAARAGLVVIDDPASIIRCSNKVFLAECLQRKRIPVPKTLVVHRNNADTIARTVGLPCVLKEPDSSFSQGVIRVGDEQALDEQVKRLLARSDLIVAQAFLPTDYDWRVGVLAGEPLFVCRYYMVRHHWQIYRREGSGRVVSGGFDTLPVEDAPPSVVKLGVRAARAMGDGFYGVDIKSLGKRFVVMEVNDNPSVEKGVEDKVLGKVLYSRVMQTLFDRVMRRKQG